jgi:hypothetical protein
VSASEPLALPLIRVSSSQSTSDCLGGLITAFESREQYERREENFLEVMQDAREGGPALLNNKSPAELREVIDRGVYTSH